MSPASLKDYETGKTIPSPDTVLAMSETYKTPELKWMHCSTMCPIGREVAKTDPNLGIDDIHLTYFELAVSFSKVAQIESNLREIISDEKLSPDEVPIMEEILAVMDRITENAKDLRIWIEKQNRSK